MKYAIIGVGGIGGYYGGRLAEGGHDVHFLLHSDYEHVKQNGLIVKSKVGDFHLKNPNIYQHAAEMPQCEVIIICLKTTQNHLLKNILPHILKPNSLIITFQNGLGIEDELAKSFPQASIAGALCFICSMKEKPGEINHIDFGHIIMGKHVGNCDETLSVVAQHLNNCKVKTTITPDLNTARWKKLGWNMIFNGLTVIWNTTTDIILNNPEKRNLVIQIMQEIIKAGTACGAKFNSDFIEKSMIQNDSMVPYSPSMKLDFDAHRPMEIRAIYTNPINAAQKNNYTMTLCKKIEQKLLQIEQTRNPKS